MKVKRNVRLRVEEMESRFVPSTVTAPPAPPVPYALWNSSNWSGIDLDTTKGAVTAVYGSWVVPAVTASGTGYSAAWVGIDGDLSSTVEQIGTESDTAATAAHDGTPQYYAWFEMYPAGWHYTTPQLVNAGDQITASVIYMGQTKTGGKTNDNFQLYIMDSGSATNPGWTAPFSTIQSVPNHQIAQRNSAEWIQEAPASGSVLPLADFGSITFTDAHATIGGATGTIASFVGKPAIVNYGTAANPREINLMDMGTVNRAGQWTSVKDETSLLSASGDSFTIQFGSTNPPAPGGMLIIKGLNDRSANLSDVNVASSAAPAGSGPNMIVVDIFAANASTASPLNRVLATETTILPGVRAGAALPRQPEVGLGRSGLVASSQAVGAAFASAGAYNLGLPPVPGAIVPLAVMPGHGDATPAVMRFEASAEPLGTAWSPIEQLALEPAPTFNFSEDAHLNDMVGVLALAAFLPSLQVRLEQEEAEQVRRLPDGYGRRA